MTGEDQVDADPRARADVQVDADQKAGPDARGGTGLRARADEPDLDLDEQKATRNLRNGLISVLVLIALVVGLVLAVPGLHSVGHQVATMPIGWLAVAVGCEAMCCVCYVVAFLQVFKRAPVRFGARVALSELAFGAAVSLGGAGSIAVGAWLLIERGGKPARVVERSAVLFLLTSAVNLLVLAIAGLAMWLHVLPGRHSPLLSLLPGSVGVIVFAGFLALPWLTARIVGPEPGRLGVWMTVTSETIVTTVQILRRPDWKLVGAWGYLLFDIAVLYVCFHAIGHTPPVAIVILAYQIGYLSNLIPIPGGIGVLDGSFIGMFALYGVSASFSTPATLVYHAISLWVPAVWGTVAYVLLRRTRNQPLQLRAVRGEPQVELKP